MEARRGGDFLSGLHRLRQKLYQIFETTQTKDSAQGAFRAWIEAVKRSRLTCFDPFIATLETWMEEITNYFPIRFSSRRVEGLNN